MGGRLNPVIDRMEPSTWINETLGGDPFRTDVGSRPAV